MPQIKFARTRWQYDSYTDLWKLAWLSDFLIVFTDEIDWDSNDTYITAPMNGELKHRDNHLQDRNCKIVLWNLERPGDGTVEQYRDDSNSLIENGVIDQVIVSDKQLAKDTGFTYVPLGGHAGLGEPGTEKMYDLVHLMAYSNRRGEWFQEPSQNRRIMGQFTVAQNGWGEDRHKALQASRFMFNIHQDNHPYIEPLRFVLAAAYGLPIITEESSNYWPYDIYHYITFKLGREMDVIGEALQQYKWWDVVGKDMRKTMCENWTFRNMLEEFLV